MKWYYKTVIFIVVGLLVGLYIYFADFNPINYDELLLKRITELELKIDSINDKKDSIRMVIDSTHVKIITNEKHYQERISIIINQSASADSSYITDYIRQYRLQDSLLNIERARETEY